MTKILFTASRVSHLVQFHIPYLQYYHGKGYEIHTAAQGTADFPVPVVQHEMLFEKQSPLKNIRSILAMRRIIKTENIDIVISNATLAGAITRAALMLTFKKPIVIHSCHGYLFSDSTPRLKKYLLIFIEKLFAPFTNLAVTMNQEDFAAAQKYKLGRQTALIPGVGIRPQKEENCYNKATVRSNFHVAEDVLLLVYAAEFSNRKNQLQLIQAITPLLRKHTDWCLLLAGSGSTFLQCQQLVQETNMENQILLPGFVASINELLSVTDIVISFSKSEGLPFNIMEAMEKEISVAASKIKGHIDLIEDGKTGYLFSLTDKYEFQEKIEALASNPQKRAQFAKDGKTTVQQFTLPNVFPVVVKTYALADSRLL